MCACIYPHYITIDVHNEMRNTTTRIAVEIKNLPGYEFDWNDHTPQCPVESLTEDDILPSENDGIIIYNRMVAYVKKFLIDTLDSLEHLRSNNHAPEAHGQKSVVIPMKLLFRDEKYTDENNDFTPINK